MLCCVVVATISADSCGLLFFGFTKFFLSVGSIALLARQSVPKIDFDQLFQYRLNTLAC